MASTPYTRSDFKELVTDALLVLGRSARLAAVAEHIWKNHEPQLKASGKILYTWQYDMRWASQALSDQGLLVKEKTSKRWTLI